MRAPMVPAPRMATLLMRFIASPRTYFCVDPRSGSDGLARGDALPWWMRLPRNGNWTRDRLSSASGQVGVSVQIFKRLPCHLLLPFIGQHLWGIGQRHPESPCDFNAHVLGNVIDRARLISK